MNRPLILLYNLPVQSPIRLVCLKMRIHVREVHSSEYAEPVGALAGYMPLTETVFEGETFKDEMLVMVNFDGTLLNKFLQEIRASRIPGVALKAVLTPDNMKWDSVKLHDELKREHEALHYKQP